MSTKKYKKVKLHSQVTKKLKTAKKVTTKQMETAVYESKIYSNLAKGLYVAPRKPSKAEVAKFKSSTKAYDEAYLKAFYKKNRVAINYGLRKRDTLDNYVNRSLENIKRRHGKKATAELLAAKREELLSGKSQYELFKDLVLDKMFEADSSGIGHDFSKRIVNPYEKKKLTLKESINKVYKSKWVFGEKQVQKENFKKMLKDNGWDLRNIRDPKTGKIISVGEMELDEEESDKEHGVYVYKVGNIRITMGKYKKGETSQWFNAEYI